MLNNLTHNNCITPVVNTLLEQGQKYVNNSGLTSCSTVLAAACYITVAASVCDFF